ncbi:MAG: Heavy metal efflux outer membrane protein, CzcC family, partial [bacterium]|nr:Heavy metal efflux outer membrane protein, CzcC family [bacterium]
MAKPLMLPRALVAIALVLVAAPPARAQPEEAPLVLPDPLTLDSALDLFRKRGLDLLISDAAVASAEGDIRIAGAVPNPNWSLFGSYSFTYDANASNSSLESPWGVTAGLGDSNALVDSLSGKRWLRLKVARAALAAARMSRADAQRSLELAVKTAYITAVQARDNLDFALQVQQGGNQIFQLNQTRYNAGAISEADLAKVETMKLEADQAVDASGQALRAAKVQLAFLLGVRGSVPDYKVDQDLPKFRVPAAMANATADSLVGTAIDHRPDLKALGFQRERALAAISLAHRQRFPDLSLNVQYSQQAGTTNAAAQPPTVSFGVIGSFPLFYFQQGEI